MTRQVPRVLLPALLAAAAVVGTLGPAAAGPATAAPLAVGVTDDGPPATSDDRPAFYEPPATVPAEPGVVLRAEPMDFFLDPARAVRAPARATRVMYTSTDRTGQPIAVTGSVLVPSSPWQGPGSRPLVTFAVGTQGLADRCAPSRQLSAGSEYEGGFLSGLLNRGYAVAVTDYEGLGTPGVHTYMTRRSQAAAVLDIVRAARRLPDAGVPAEGPAAVVGYSQGGGAAAAAAELAPTYAGELALVGAVAGAVPADLAGVGESLDGGPYASFALYAVAGLATAYDVDLDALLNEEGLQRVRRVGGECVGDSLPNDAFVRSTSLTRDGRPLAAYFDEEPWRAILGDNVIGKRRPAVPVLLTHSLADDVIPYAVGLDLARRWCGLGVSVRFSTTAVPTHVGGVVPNFAEEYAFLEARLAGVPATSTCGLL
ncbi:lipase family protein [Knoellia sp. 3-2P3]|uniref:lipase family protein n=1 Tax=unclassified Knoellia TaxID=2618719 RepID=UPI0023DAB281|nr:lipase family protein [Knoellia sp. 3-2P3]MDF2094325.1 lipase family protein [Knoellia sp. 3-2P3]